MRAVRLATLLILCGLTLAACARSDTVDFTLNDLDGKSVRLSDFRGKWVVVNYWATWCPPCREEMPELEVFHSAHKDDHAVVLGVNMEGISEDKLRAFVEEQFISFPILRARMRSRTELGQVPGLPTTYLVSPEGRTVARKVGPVTKDLLENYIRQYERERSESGGS